MIDETPLRPSGPTHDERTVAVLVTTTAYLFAGIAGQAARYAPVEATGNLALAVAHATANRLESFVDQPIEIIVVAVASLRRRRYR